MPKLNRNALSVYPKKLHNQAGFTLIELIASLFILIAILDIFIFISSSLNSSAVLRDSLIASNLAQEGVEVVRNVRDRDWFLGNSFGASLPDGSWRVQWDSAFLLLLSGNPFLKKDMATGVFGYSAGNDTVFKRAIDVLKISANEIKVISTVTWDEKSNPKTTNAETHLFNWYQP